MNIGSVLAAIVLFPALRASYTNRGVASVPKHPPRHAITNTYQPAYQLPVHIDDWNHKRKTEYLYQK